MLAVVAPGQGSQTPGFLTPWLELPRFADRVRWLGTVAGIDLIKHGTESDADTIRDTSVAQPLIASVGMVSLLELFPNRGQALQQVSVGAGHSLGEITAATAAHVLSAEQAMVFIRERANAMAKAAAVLPTGMTAVLGGDRADVLATIKKFGLTAANDNGGGQIVAAGTLEELEQLAQNPPEGARIRPLAVAGAFHTKHMNSAAKVLTQHARAISTDDSRINLLSNADGTVLHSGRAVLTHLVRQVSHPVRWDLCMQTMLDLGVTGIIELPPAGILTGLAKRGMPGVETFALNSPEDLPAAAEFVAKHGTPSNIKDLPTWRVVLSPFKGTFEQTCFAQAGEVLAENTEIGKIHDDGETYKVTAPYGGEVGEWLVTDGAVVKPGELILRLRPGSVAW
ncbi:MAG: acyltransferase domain-containing protein [Actinobacteria bacterium]|nr:acyltransferase domain-containing protein [Actinomycetota bacterium]